jgi:hypothetical protein
MAALKVYPKVYWIWNHRRWCLENVPSGPEDDLIGWKKASWERELAVIEKLLEIDGRNCERFPSSLTTAGFDGGYSPCVGLQEIRTGKHACGEARVDRVSVHHAQDRVKLLQLQRMASAVQGSPPIMGKWSDRRRENQGRRYVQLLGSALTFEGSMISSVQNSSSFIMQCTRTQMTKVCGCIIAGLLVPVHRAALIRRQFTANSSGYINSIGDDRALLEREISVIKELLDEQPDSKCLFDARVHWIGLNIILQGAWNRSCITNVCLSVIMQVPVKRDLSSRNAKSC